MLGHIVQRLREVGGTKCVYVIAFEISHFNFKQCYRNSFGTKNTNIEESTETYENGGTQKTAKVDWRAFAYSKGTKKQNCFEAAVPHY